MRVKRKSIEPSVDIKADEFSFLGIFLRGLTMGLADVVPGVSGGTIAFITGIYERFIHGISNIGTFIKQLGEKLIGKRKESFGTLWKLVDYKFFIPLVFGTSIAFLIGSKFIPELIKVYPAQVFGFFVGLILASAFVVYLDIPKHSTSGILLGLVSIIFGFLLANIPGADSGVTPNLFWIMLVGAISISAMLLPGISGSYIVLIFGQYTFLLSIIYDLANLWPYFVAFAIGSVLGLLFFSRALSYFLKNHKSYTFYALTGVMIGAVYRPGVDAVKNFSDSTSIVMSVVLLLLGVVLVLVLNRMTKKK